MTADVAVAKLALIWMGSSTHSMNTDQRQVPLKNIVANGDVYTATLPGDGEVIPGHYYLFIVLGMGVPSMAQTVRVFRI